MRKDIRQHILHWLFGLLYGRLGRLHEFAGRTLFGRAWDARRKSLISDLANFDVVLDIGCGEGRLLGAMRSNHGQRVGVEPSASMARRARRCGVSIVRAQAQRLPLQSGTISEVICSYPGPWLFDPRTWGELERVMRPGARVSILLGGTIQRGPAAQLRRLAFTVAYGRTSIGEEPPRLGSSRIVGEFERRVDEWGEAIYWFGVRD